MGFGLRDWFAARILSGREKIIEFYMGRENISVFFPQVEGRRLFPGYAFMRFDRDLDWWYSINNTHGVIHLLPVKNEQPIALPPGFVDDLKSKIDAGGFTVRAAHELVLSYLPGQEVSVVNGTYAGLGGELIRYNKGSLTLLMMMFNRKVEVTVKKTDVKAA